MHGTLTAVVGSTANDVKQQHSQGAHALPIAAVADQYFTRLKRPLRVVLPPGGGKATVTEAVWSAARGLAARLGCSRRQPGQRPVHPAARPSGNVRP